MKKTVILLFAVFIFSSVFATSCVFAADATYTVSTAQEFSAAVSAINAADDGNYIISIADDITCDRGTSSAAFTFRKNTTTIIGNGHTVYFTDVSPSNINIPVRIDFPISVYNEASAQKHPKLILGDETDSSNTLTFKADTVTRRPGGHFISVGDIGSDKVGFLEINDGVIIDSFQSSNTYGGGVLVSGPGSELVMNGGVIKDCHIGFPNTSFSYNYGGGVAVICGGKFTMNGGSITDCSVATSQNLIYAYSQYGYTFSEQPWQWPQAAGGGVYVCDKSQFIMTGGTISGCSATFDGGGVMILPSDSANNDGYGSLDSSFIMTGGTISDCSAGLVGGGIACVGSAGDTPTGVIGIASGPDISFDEPCISITGGTITGNSVDATLATIPEPSAPYAGGGIFINCFKSDIPIEIKDTVISNNSAKIGGGISIYGYGTNVKIEDSAITENIAEANGAGISAIANSSGGKTIIKDTAITDNMIIDEDEDISNRGGGVYYDANSRVELSGGVVIYFNLYNISFNNLNILDSSHPVYVVGSLEGSMIGISDPSLWEDGVEDYEEGATVSAKLTSGYATYNSGTDPSACFTSDHITWSPDYSEDETEVRLVKRESTPMFSKIVTFRTVVDSGFCSDSYKPHADADSTGAIAVSAIVENFENVMDDIAEFGFLVTNDDIDYRTVALSEDSYSALMESRYGAFYTIFYGIPFADFNKEITVSPYVIDSKGAMISGAAFSVMVENTSKWLGSVDTMKKNHSSPKITVE